MINHQTRACNTGIATLLEGSGNARVGFTRVVAVLELKALAVHATLVDRHKVGGRAGSVVLAFFGIEDV